MQSVLAPIEEQIDCLVHDATTCREDKVLRYRLNEVVIHSYPTSAARVEGVTRVVASSGHLAVMVNNCGIENTTNAWLLMTQVTHNGALAILQCVANTLVITLKFRPSLTSKFPSQRLTEQLPNNNI